MASFYFLLPFIHILCIILTGHLSHTLDGSSSDKLECKKWEEMAKKMTGSGHAQTCVSNKNPVKCTRIDCTGTVRFQHDFLPDGLLDDIPMELDYCFGSQLNSCDKPLSADFYLQVPNLNVTLTHKVHHNEELAVPGLQIPVSKIAKISPVLFFTFEPTLDGNYEFSVKSKVKLITGMFDPYYIPQWETTLIDKETLHAESCSGKVHTTTNVKDLIIGQCHPGKYPTPPPVIHGNTEEKKPSKTLGKKCDHTRGLYCDYGEMCEGNKCTCSIDFEQSGSSCVSSSHLGDRCTSLSDCGPNEICVPKDTFLVCQCKSGYIFHKGRELCMVSKQGKKTHEDKPTNWDTGEDHSTESSKPVSPSNPQAHSHDGNKSTDSGGKSMAKSTIIIVACTISAVVIVLAAVVGTIIFVRRRRRQRNDYGRSEPLLGGNDDDTDLIM